jgi:hypothetical protein
MVRFLKKSTAFVKDRLLNFLIFEVIIAAGSGSRLVIALGLKPSFCCYGLSWAFDCSNLMKI